MKIGRRLRELRIAKGISLLELERRSGLINTAHFEAGHTTPGLATLEKWAKGLDVPLYAVFLEPHERSQLAPESKEERYEAKLRSAIRQMSESDRKFFLGLARDLAGKR